MASWEHSARGFIKDLDSLLEHYENEGIAGVADVPMRGRFNDSCTFCEYKKWCDLGRNTSKAAIRATFTESTWDPTAVGE